MKVPFLALDRQHQELKAEIIELISSLLDKAEFIGGAQVQNFEKEFAHFCGAKTSVGVSSGTDALRFALIALGIGNGDEVITVPHTFIATAEAITQVGAKPVFVDIDPKTYTMDPCLIEDKISDKTRAIIPVHIYGHPADMDPILNIAQEYNLYVIEDACQAVGAKYKGRNVGTLGDIGCFSFYPGKNLGACGEAGAIVTNKADLADKIKMIRDHGQRKKYYHEIEGYNGRLDAIQAGILRIKLKRISQWNECRRNVANWYTQSLSCIPEVVVPVEAEFARSVYHLYVILARDRDGLLKFMQEKDIWPGLHYPIPLHLQKAYEYLQYSQGDFPVTEHIASRLISLPIFPEMTKDQVHYVAEVIKDFYK